MFKYIVKRILSSLLALLGVVTITFFIARVIPPPARRQNGPDSGQLRSSWRLPGLNWDWINPCRSNMSFI